MLRSILRSQNAVGIYSIFLILFLNSCSNKTEVERSFYYWRSDFKIDSSDINYFQSNNIGKLYLRLFDIKWNKQENKFYPEAIIKFNSAIPNLHIVPVIYITNEVFLNENNIELISSNTLKLINSLCTNHQINFTELQFDCDWSGKSKVNYFKFLEIIKSKQPTITMSATIRLHQIKYKNITGVPPVDRGMLMFYNMGKLESIDESNSISNEAIAKQYTESIKDFPLALDVALPAFSWSVQFRNNKMYDLLNELNSNDFKNNPNFKQIDINHFSTDSGFFYKGYYFMKNDLVRTEEVNPTLCLKAAKLLSDKIQSKNMSVSLYSYQAKTKYEYDKQALENIYSVFY